jgi:hypothetical protein
MSSDNTETVRNFIAAAVLGLFGWHLLTLHNIAKSVDVLVHQVGLSNQRIERLENFVYFKDGPGKESIR